MNIIIISEHTTTARLHDCTTTKVGHVVGDDNSQNKNGIHKTTIRTLESDFGRSPMRRCSTTYDNSDRLICLGKYPTCALASSTNTSVVAEGGCKGYHSYCTDTHMSKRSVHARSRSKEARMHVSWEIEPMHSGVFCSRTICLS